MISTKPCAPAYSMGKVERGTQFDKNPQVGPGKYELKLRKQSPSYSLGAQISSLKPFMTPAPGSYNIPSKMVETQGFTAGTKRASSSFKSDIPGPGSYNTNKPTINISYSLGQRAKDYELEKISKLPGPASYAVKSIEKNKAPEIKFSVSSRNQIQGMKSSPGPGTYDSKLTRKSISFKIGQRLPDIAFANQIKGIVSPDQYSPKHSNILPKSSSWKFGSCERTDLVPQEYKKTPGVGTYQYPQYVGQLGSSRLMHARVNQPDFNKYKPGPGTYDQEYNKLKLSSPNYSIGEKRKEIQSPTMSLGPGSYELKLRRSSPEYKIGDERRFKKQLQTIGPGQYDHQGVVGKDGPSITIGEKRESVVLKQYKLLPGPGTHELKSQFATNNKSFCRRTELRFKPKKSEAPGPAAYKLPSLVGNLPNYESRVNSGYRFI